MVIITVIDANIHRPLRNIYIWHV